MRGGTALRGSRSPRFRSSWSSAHTDATARLLGIGVLACGAGWLATSCLQQDFAAYYTAGAAVARGLDPYTNHVAAPGGPWDGVAVYRHSRFLYAPLVAHLFRPLAALPFLWAKGIFTALSLGALWVAVAMAQVAPASRPDLAVAAGHQSAGGPMFMRSAWVLGALWSPVLLTLERGQIDLLLLAALAAAWRFRARSVALSGALLALVALAKPFALGVLPVLVVGRQRRWAVATMIALGAVLALTTLCAGRAATATYLTDVLPRAARFGEGGPAEWLLPEAATASVDADLDQGRARLGGRSYSQEIGSFRRNASLPRLLAGDDEPSALVGVLVAVVLIGAAAWAARRAPESPFGYWAGLVAVTLAAPVSWAMGLVWALPVLALIPLGFRWRRRDVPPAARRLCLLAFVAALIGPLLAAAWIVAGAAVIGAGVIAAGRENETWPAAAPAPEAVP